MDNMEFWNEHVITHKLVYLRKDGKAETICVGSINMCKRYVQQHDKLNIIIKEL